MSSARALASLTSVSIAAAICVALLSLPAGASAQTFRRTCTPAVGAAAPFGTTLCFGARPGAFIQIPKSANTCTLGFLYRDRKTGRSYMTTSGHCILPATGERTWSPGTGPAALDDLGKRVGTFVFAIMRETKDFALLLIDRNVKPNPQVCHFGGPIGLNDERFPDPEVLSFYGQAEVVSDASPARSGVTVNTRGEELIYAMAPVGLGDSGGPWLTDDGRALGYVTHIVAYGARVGEAGTALVRRLGPQVATAQHALKLRLSLVTAPVLP